MRTTTGPTDRGSSGLRAMLPFTFALLFLIVIALTWDSLNPTIQVSGIALSIAGILFWLYPSLKRETIQFPKLTIPLLIFWLYQSISILWSVQPIPAIQKSLLGILSLFLFAITASLLKNRVRWTVLLNALLGLGIIISFLELFLFIVWLISWWSGPGQFPSLPPVGYRLLGLLLGHANATSGYFYLIVPYVVFRMVRTNQMKDRIGWGLLLLLFGSVEYLASSRGGWISLGLGIAILLCYLVWERYQSWENLRRFIQGNRRQIGFAGIALVLISVAASAVLIGQIRRTGHAIGFGSRGPIWEPAIALIRESPIFGNGWGAFSTLFAREIEYPQWFATSHAHNLILQIWAEHGILGIGLLAAIMIGILRSIKSTWIESDRDGRLLTVLAIASLLPVATHQMVDYLFESPLYASGVLLWLAILHRRAPDDRQLSISSRWLPIAIMPLVIVIGLFVSFSLPGSFSYWRGVSAFRAGDANSAQAEICAAAEQNPRFSLYFFQCGVAIATETWERPTSGSMERAESAIQTGLNLDPNWAPHWVNLSAIQWAMGSADPALESIKEALQLSPNDARYLWFQGFMLEMIGEDNAAKQSYQAALEKDPWLAFDDYFQADEERRLLSSEFRNSFQESTQDVLWRAWNQALNGEVEEAASRFKLELSKQPTNPIVYAGIALTEYLSGDLRSAYEEIRIARFIGPQEPMILRIEREIAAALGLSAEVARLSDEIRASYYESSQSWQYYSRTYLKFFIPPDLVPQFFDALIMTTDAPSHDQGQDSSDQSTRKEWLQWIESVGSVTK